MTYLLGNTVRGLSCSEYPCAVSNFLDRRKGTDTSCSLVRRLLLLAQGFVEV